MPTTKKRGLGDGGRLCPHEQTTRYRTFEPLLLLYPSGAQNAEGAPIYTGKHIALIRCDFGNHGLRADPDRPGHYLVVTDSADQAAPLPTLFDTVEACRAAIAVYEADRAREINDSIARAGGEEFEP